MSYHIEDGFEQNSRPDRIVSRAVTQNHKIPINPAFTIAIKIERNPLLASKFYSIKRFMDALSWDGTLTSRDFLVSARAFAGKWKEFNSAFPPWTWVPCPPKQPPCHLPQWLQQGYLSLEKICLPGSSKKGHVASQEDVDEISLTEGEEELEPVDNATLVETNNSLQVCYYDFHIVYSDSYRVPVLYFRGYYIDGQPLALAEIEKDLPACSAKVLLESKWTFITQEEHPYLNRPWYKLHPCGTGEWMKLLFLGDDSLAKNGVAVEQYLVSWLSVVGQVVGIRIPFEMLNSPKSCN